MNFGDYRALFAHIAEAAKAGETYDSMNATDDGFGFAFDLVTERVPSPTSQVRLVITDKG